MWFLLTFIKIKCDSFILIVERFCCRCYSLWLDFLQWILKWFFCCCSVCLSVARYVFTCISVVYFASKTLEENNKRGKQIQFAGDSEININHLNSHLISLYISIFIRSLVSAQTRQYRVSLRQFFYSLICLLRLQLASAYTQHSTNRQWKITKTTNE